MITAVTTIFGLLVASLLLMLVRRDHLHISHGVGWSVAIALSALLGFAPGIFDALASAIGIAALEDGDVAVIENLRFNAGETAKDAEVRRLQEAVVALQQDEIPARYRDEAVAIFDFLKNYPIQPKDPATQHAMRALREALPEDRG